MEPTQLSDDVKAPSSRCKNCGEKLSKRGKFCPSCGQRDFDGRIRMRDMLGKFISSLTHLDNKFVKMAWQLFIPGKVSVEYFQGKIKRYPHPLQFFFIVMFFFLLILSQKFKNASIDIFGGNFQIGGEVKVNAENVTVERSKLFDALNRCMISKAYRHAIDSMPETWKTESALQMQDSIHDLLSRPWETATTQLLRSFNEPGSPPNTLDSLHIFIGVSKLTVSTMDFVNLEPDSISRKYQLKSWIEQGTLKQSIKAIRDQQGFINRYLGSFGWTILVSIALMATILKLAFRRSRTYYVEHFIFLIHQKAGTYLLLTIALLINNFFFSLTWLWFVVLLWLMISPIIALRRFYNESWPWTIFKGLIYISFNLIALIVLFIATLLLVFAVF